jgi:hypothetical protein
MDKNEMTVSLTLRGSDQHLLLALKKLNAHENYLGVETEVILTHIAYPTTHLRDRTVRYTSIECFFADEAFLAAVDRPEIAGRVVRRLQRGSIRSVDDLLMSSPQSLLDIYDFGPGALEFVQARLSMAGLRLAES